MITPIAFVVAWLLAGPVVALGIAANGLGVSLALLWSVPRSRAGSRAAWALLWVSSALATAVAAWLAIAVQNAIG
ncbi:hypothetical protein [Polymorphospora lycopeni]|uniref:Uncharacterized protein n=1 Tax=Polymorphospora lycopeni TaxID=3140240 RepID=A0ABV5CMS6_9ACTN